MVLIAAVTHKEYSFQDDPLYLPVMAGASLCVQVPDKYVRDDSGDNISERNGTFSELTALYWLWKNHESLYPDADHLGLCHYRRYFASGRGRRKRIMERRDAERLTHKESVILPKHRNYIIETNYSQYAHAHHRRDLDAAREVIAERCPGYLPAYDRRMAMKKGHRFNMFIMPAGLFDDYCSWLFDILFELERRLDTGNYTGRDRRVFGLVAERLLDVWIDSRDIEYTEVPYIMTEPEHLLLKGFCLAGRKLKAGSGKAR